MGRILETARWASYLLLVSAVVPSHAIGPASEIAVGARVIPKMGTVIRLGEIEVDARSDVFSKSGEWTTLRTYRVTHSRTEWVWIESEDDSLRGWVLASQVVPLEQAAAQLTSLLRSSPGDSQALDCRGAIRLVENDVDHAIADFDMAIRLDPRNKLARADRARAWLLKNEYAKALADLDAVIDLNPRCTGAFGNRGRIYCIRGDSARAMSDLNRAIDLNPENSTAFGVRGSQWLVLNDPAKALADLDRAIRINPKYAKAFVARGAAWTMKGDYDKALVDYDRAIQIEPTNAMAFSNRGIILGTVRSDYERALSDLDKALRIEPTLVNALINRGVVWSRKGDYAKALVAYDETIRIEPKSALAYNNIAWLCATCPDSMYRDGRRAVELATLANSLLEEEGPIVPEKASRVLQTLAAAYAESQEFDTAVQFQEKALGMIQKRDSEGRKVCRLRLETYRARKPYRDQEKIHPQGGTTAVETGNQSPVK